MNTGEQTERVEFLPIAKCVVKHDLRGGALSERDKEIRASIKAKGVAQPILVRPVNGSFEVVAGRKRYRFAKEAGLDKIPALVRTMTDAEAAEFELIENLHREDLSPLEEAEGLKRLRDEFKLSIEQLEEKIGRKRTYVYDSLKLCELAPPVKKALAEGKIDRTTAIRLAQIVPDSKLQSEAVAELSRRDGGHRDNVKYLFDRYASEQKQIERWNQAVMEAQKEGCRVLSDAQSAEVFSGAAENEEWLAIDGSVEIKGKEKRIGALLKQAEVKPVLAKGESGEPIRLVGAEVFEKALVKLGIDTGGGSEREDKGASPVKGKPTKEPEYLIKQRAEAKKAVATRKVLELAMVAVGERASNFKADRWLWRLIALNALEASGAMGARCVAAANGLFKKGDDGYQCFPKVRKLIESATEDQLRGLVAQAICAPRFNLADERPTMREAAEHYGVDFKKLRTTATKPKPKAAPAKKEKAKGRTAAHATATVRKKKGGKANK